MNEYEEGDVIKQGKKEYIVIEKKPRTYKVRAKISYGKEKWNWKLSPILTTIKRRKTIMVKKKYVPKTKATWLVKK